MKRENFTLQEAASKVGKTIRTKVEWSGVPKGSTGKVVKADKVTPREKG